MKIIQNDKDSFDADCIVAITRRDVVNGARMCVVYELRVYLRNGREVTSLFDEVQERDGAYLKTHNAWAGANGTTKP